MKKIEIGKVSEFIEGEGKLVEVDGKEIAIFKIDNQFYAINDLCTHAEASLSEGNVCEAKVNCPWHGAQFCLKTGKALTLPATEDVKTYAIRTEDDKVVIEI